MLRSWDMVYNDSSLPDRNKMFLVEMNPARLGKYRYCSPVVSLKWVFFHRLKSPLLDKPMQWVRSSWCWSKSPPVSMLSSAHAGQDSAYALRPLFFIRVGYMGQLSCCLFAAKYSFFESIGGGPVEHHFITVL